MNHPSTAAVLTGCDCTDCHPSEAAYAAGCKCDPCMRRRMRIRKRHHVRVANGPVMISDPALVRKLRALIAEGYGPTLIGQTAGLGGDGVILGLLAGGRTDRTKYARLTRLTRADILTHAPDRAHVPPIGAQRRIQALMRIGWAQTSLADGDATILRMLSDISRGNRKYILAGNHRRVAALYDRLCMTPGPSEIARARAKKRGFPSPLAWDDNIDDPNAEPDIGGPADTDKERQARYDLGMSDRAIAEELHSTSEKIRQWRRDNQLPSNFAKRSA